MIEIHYHLLFATDDGPRDVEASIALAEASIAEGVTHIVATPHANDHHHFVPEANREKLNQIQERVGDRLTLGLGCDFHLSFDNIEDLRHAPRKYTINGHRYLLVEFPDYGIAPNSTETFSEMLASGLVPIITHPERNLTLQADPGRLAEWLEKGCIVQITAASLTGRFGRRAETVAKELLKDGWVHLIASDAHSLDKRPPSLREAHRWVSDHYSPDTADRLCLHAPRAVFYGAPLPPSQDPGSLDKKSSGGILRRFFQR